MSASTGRPALPASAEPGRIRVGIGGWVFEPWRGTFYPDGLAQARELEFASRALATLEINGTYYRTQAPATFAKWRDAVPEGFVFALKAPRYATNRRVLAEAGDSIRRFTDEGLAELGPTLGPINWQFPPTKRFSDDVLRFLDLLPERAGDIPLRHAVELRHDSFRDRAMVDACRDRGIAIVIAGDADYPLIPDVTAEFVYLRLMGTSARFARGYAPAALGSWAARIQDLARGGAPDDLPRLGPLPARRRRDVYAYVIAGEKARNPKAAIALARRVDGTR